MADINVHDNPPANAIDVDDDEAATDGDQDDDDTDAARPGHPDAVPATFVPPGAPLGEPA